MPMTLTLKNIPDMVYAMLKATATRERRSLNSQAIHYLETSLNYQTIGIDQELAQIRALRQSLGQQSFDVHEIDAFKREGRP